MSSDSDLASAVVALRFGDYVSIATATAVTYDYIITFSKEINYVWNRPWSFVSWMFIIVRYLGLAVAVIEGLFGSTFMPGPPTVCTVLFVGSDYAFTVFLAAADIVMILRIYAMYNRSKIILGLLLLFYVTTIVVYFISTSLFSNTETNLSMTTIQVLDMSFCTPNYNTLYLIGRYKLVPRLTLAALMFVFAVARICMDAFQAYKETKQWATNRYVDLLVREGVFYFLAHLLNTTYFGQSAPGTIVSMISFVVMFVLSPRFIISVRALHLRSLLRVGWQGNGIDTGFGMSKSRDLTSRPSDMSSVGFTHVFDTPEGDVEMRVLGSGARLE